MTPVAPVTPVTMLGRLFASSLGRKYIMGLSGLALFAFVIVHMVGNLQVFLGREALNRYAAFLQGVPELLWPARIGLIGLTALHIWAASMVTLENRRATPQRYAVSQPNSASYASRTMFWSGLIVAAFIAYHLLHFTLGVTDPQNYALEETLRDGTQRHDVFAMVVRGFQQPLVSGFYVLGMALLCWHLSHGVSALFQSLGWRTPKNHAACDRFAKLSALGIFLGNSSMPLAILFGYGKDLVR